MPSTKNQFWRCRWGIRVGKCFITSLSIHPCGEIIPVQTFLLIAHHSPQDSEVKAVYLCVSARTFEKVNSSSATDKKKKKNWKTCLNNSSCQLPHSKNKVSAFFCTRWKYCMGTALQRDLSSPNLTPNFFPFKCHRPLESKFPITDSVLEHRVEGITALWLRWKCVPKVHPIQFNKMCPRTYWEQSTFVE